MLLTCYYIIEHIDMFNIHFTILKGVVKMDKKRFENVKYYRVNGELFDDSYCTWFDTHEVLPRDYTKSMLAKRDFVIDLDSLLSVHEFDALGRLSYGGFIEYAAYDAGDSYEEFVQIWHDNFSCTMVCVTADSVESMLSDIMRACCGGI